MTKISSPIYLTIEHKKRVENFKFLKLMLPFIIFFVVLYFFRILDNHGREKKRMKITQATLTMNDQVEHDQATNLKNRLFT